MLGTSLQLPLALADIPVEQAGVETLAAHDGQHWFWVWGNRAPTQLDGRAFLFDDSGKMLGQLDTGFWFNSLLPAQSRNELFFRRNLFQPQRRGHPQRYGDGL